MEVVVSTTLLSILIALVVTLFPTAVLAGARASQETFARDLADSIIESLQAGDFNALPTLAAAPTTFTGCGGLAFVSQVQLFNVPLSNPANVRGVRVIVGWNFRNRSYSVVEETCLARLPR